MSEDKLSMTLLRLEAKNRGNLVPLRVYADLSPSGVKCVDDLIGSGGIEPGDTIGSIVQSRQIGKSMLAYSLLIKRLLADKQVLHLDGDIYAVPRHPYIIYEVSDLSWLIYSGQASRITDMFICDSITGV